MTTPRRSGHRLLVIGAALVLAAGGSIAFAQWVATGTGQGSAKAGHVRPLTTQSATTSGEVYPGGTGTLSLMVNNPNPFPVTLTSVTPNGTITSDSSACD